MTTVDILILALIISAFVVFGLTLSITAWWTARAPHLRALPRSEKRHANPTEGEDNLGGTNKKAA